jgi:hypothetical protein
MDTYKTRMNSQETADEMNQNTQYLYVYDYIYLLCKVFLFILLGLMYYIWVGKKEVTDAYENTKETVSEGIVKANQKIKELKEMKDIKTSNPVTSR